MVVVAMTVMTMVMVVMMMSSLWLLPQNAPHQTLRISANRNQSVAPFSNLQLTFLGHRPLR